MIKFLSFHLEENGRHLANCIKSKTEKSGFWRFTYISTGDQITAEEKQMVIGQERWTTCSLLLSLGLLLLLVLPLFVLVLGHPRIDQLRAVLHHLPDQPLCLKLVQGLPRQRPADLHPLGDDRGRDELVGRHLREASKIF